jgi:hypothetical protein
MRVVTKLVAMLALAAMLALPAGAFASCATAMPAHECCHSQQETRPLSGPRECCAVSHAKPASVRPARAEDRLARELGRMLGSEAEPQARGRYQTSCVQADKALSPSRLPLLCIFRI